MKATEVTSNGRLIGWIARAGSVHGVWTEFTPPGFMIQPYIGANTPDREQFQPTIYKTRGEAKRELISAYARSAKAVS